MITALLRIPVSEERKDEVTQLLRSLIEPTRVETGCISCRLYQELRDPYVLTWVEEWETRDDLDRHLRSPRFKKILAALARRLKLLPETGAVVAAVRVEAVAARAAAHETFEESRIEGGRGPSTGAGR